VIRKLIDFIDYGFTYENVLIDKLERWCEENRDVLQKNYIDPSGLVGPSLKHKSSKNYLKVAESLGLVKNFYGKWLLTKYGNVLSKLPEYEQSLELGVHEICFFVKLLLKKDITNLLALRQALKETEKPSEIPEAFKKAVLEEVLRNYKKTRDPHIQLEIQKRLQKIKVWRPYRLNHIIIPRIHWLIDLKIIDWEKYRHRILSIQAKRDIIFESISREIEKTTNIDDWIDNTYYEIFYSAYKDLLPSKVKFWKDIGDSCKYKVAEECIEKGFKILGSHEMRRVSLIPLLEYFGICLLIDNGIIVSFKELHEQIRKVAMSRKDLTYRWVPYDKDGYIRQIS